MNLQQMKPCATMCHQDDSKAGIADSVAGADPEPGRSMTGASSAPQNETCATNRSALTLDVICDGGDWSTFGEVEELVMEVALVLAAHPAAQDALPAGVALLLSDDQHIRDLNCRFRGKDAPTNVLSFPPAPLSPAPDHQSPVHPLNAAAHGCVPGGGAETFLGDIILSAETVMREADEQDKAPAHHFQHLVLHGLLHLLGFDHESEADATEMEQLEIELLQSLNIRNPYGDCA